DRPDDEQYDNGKKNQPEHVCPYPLRSDLGTSLLHSALFTMHYSSLKIIIGVIEPVLTDRAEQIELEGVLERLGLVLDPGRDVQHLAFADGDFLAADQKLERTLQDVGHLLALVRVHRHQAAALQIDLG